MKTQLLALSLSTCLVITSLSGCSGRAPRITPGHLETSQNVSGQTARITNIVQLSEKEAPGGKVFLGALTGFLIGAIITDDHSDSTQDFAQDIGGDIGEALVLEKYGKTIYRLTLALNDGSVKHIHVRGGDYVVGRHAKVTVNKKSGDITSLVALKT